MKKLTSIRYLLYLPILILLLMIPFFKDHTTIDMKALDTSLQKQHNKDYVVKTDKSSLRKFYHIDFDDVEDFILYVPATSMRVNEILVAKVKEENKLPAFMEAIKNRNASQLKVFQGYGPKQCELLKNAIILQKGNYLIYIVGEDAKALQNVVEKEVHS